MYFCTSSGSEFMVCLIHTHKRLFDDNFHEANFITLCLKLKYISLVHFRENKKKYCLGFFNK